MDDNEQKKPMSEEQLLTSLKLSVTPIDFDELSTAGVLEKHGAWFELKKPNELPSHAKDKIIAIRSGPPVMVKFRAVPKKLAAQVAKAEARLATKKTNAKS